MNTMIGAAEPQPWRSPATTTAWWGFCYHCSCWFNNHQLRCPTLTSVTSTTGTNASVTWMPLNNSGG